MAAQVAPIAVPRVLLRAISRKAASGRCLHVRHASGFRVLRAQPRTVAKQIEGGLVSQ
jgi:hypothetical protein